MISLDKVKSILGVAHNFGGYLKIEFGSVVKLLLEK